MQDKQYLFSAYRGGICTHLIASLCHYNYYQNSELITFDDKGHSHLYSAKNKINFLPMSLSDSLVHSGWKNKFKIVYINPNDVTPQKENFVFTYTSLSTDDDLKFSLFNHFFKVIYPEFQKKYPALQGRDLFSQHLADIKSDIIPKHVIPDNLSSIVFNLPFADIYRNKQKVINFIEDLTETKSTDMLSLNYDRYLELQKKILQEQAPWFYDDIGHNYFT
jgi:hypothetical protein